MKRTLLSFGLMSLLAGAADQAFCQDTILYANGESADGKITLLNNSYVKLKTGNGARQKSSADEVQYVKRNATYYYSRKISVNRTQGPVLVNQFLRLKTWGRINILTYTRHFSRSSYVNYYAQKDDSSVIYIGTRTGVVTGPSITGAETAQLSLLFSDNPALQARYDKEVNKEKLKIISRYIKEYNNWYASKIQ